MARPPRAFLARLVERCSHAARSAPDQFAQDLFGAVALLGVFFFGDGARLAAQFEAKELVLQAVEALFHFAVDFQAPLARRPQPSAAAEPLPVASSQVRRRRRHCRRFARCSARCLAAASAVRLAATGNFTVADVAAASARHALHQHAGRLPPQSSAPQREQSRKSADQNPPQAIEAVGQGLNGHARIAAIHLILALRRHCPAAPCPASLACPGAWLAEGGGAVPETETSKASLHGTASRV